MKKNIHSQTIFMNKKIALVPYNSENKGVKVAKTINADVLESHDVLRLWPFVLDDRLKSV